MTHSILHHDRGVLRARAGSSDVDGVVHRLLWRLKELLQVRIQVVGSEFRV